MSEKTGAWRWTELILGSGGILLLFWMIRKIGFQTIQTDLLHFGIGPVLFLIALYFFSQLLYCAAWFVLLNNGKRGVSFRETFLAYLAGDALNMTIPSANLAGEPVKVMLIREQVTFERAMSSVTVYKLSDIFSMTLFLTFGWLAHFWFYSLPLSWDIGAGVVAGGMAGLCFILYFFQNRGIYGPVGKWLDKRGKLKLLVNKLESAHLIDGHITSYFQEHSSRFFLSLLLNFAAWFGSVLEIVLFMAISGLPISFFAALTIETFSLFINNVIFFVPARLGVGEGGRVLLFLTLGYSARAGMSYGILRRIRELVWIGTGFLVLLLRRRRVPLPQGEGELHVTY